jgi:hypothetical protein
MIDVYERLISDCRTLNQVNFAHLSLGNALTPDEMLVLWQEMTTSGRPLAHPSLTKNRAYPIEALHEAESRWIDRLKSNFDDAGKPGPEPFLRREIHRGVTLYTDGRGPAGKTLVLAFTGGSNRMMMSIPTFLQFIKASDNDVAIIRDTRRQGFRYGMEEIAPTPEEAFDRLVPMLGLRAYRHVHAIGCSGGGLPALLAALRLGLETVVDVGGNGPDDPRWVRAGFPSVAEQVVAYNAAGKTAHIALAYGAQEPRDLQTASALAALLPQAKVVEIAVPGQEVRHVALHPLVIAHQFHPFLRQHLRITT